MEESRFLVVFAFCRFVISEDIAQTATFISLKLPIPNRVLIC